MPTTNTRSPGHRRHSLYRAVLSLAVAALLAASIPFAAIYVSTPHRQPALAGLAPSSHRRHVRLITTASGRKIAVPASSSGAAARPITTRTSGSGGADD